MGDVDSYFSQADSSLSASQTNAQELLDEAQNFLNTLKNATDGIIYSGDSVTNALNRVDKGIDSLSKLTLPEPQDLTDISSKLDTLLKDIDTLDLSNISNALTNLNLQLDTVSVDTNFNIDSIESNISSITNPSPPRLDSVSLPEKPTISYDNIPTAPDEVLPEVPNLPEIEMPTLYVPTISSLNLPPLSTVVKTDVPQFDYRETPYTSDLLETARQKLLDSLNSEGLDLGIDDVLYNRELERDLQALEDELAKIRDDWSKRGFTLPNGILLDAEQKIHINHQNNLFSRSRDIAVKQVELAHQDRQEILTKSIQLESSLMQYYTGLWNRALEASRNIVAFGIEIVKLNLAKLQSEIESQRLLIDKFNAELQGELAKLQVNRNQLEEAQIKGQLNQQQIDLYKAQLSAILSKYDIYKTQVNAFVAKMQAEATKIDMYRNEIAAFTAVIDSNAKKIQAYTAQVQANTALVEQDRIKADVAIASQRAKLESQRLNLEAQRTNADIAFNTQRLAQENAQIQAKIQYDMFASKLSLLSEQLRAKRDAFLADTEVEKANYNLQEMYYRIQGTLQNYINNALLESAKITYLQAKADLDTFIENKKMNIAAAEGGAQVYAGLVQAAMSAASTLLEVGAKIVTSE